MLVLTRKIGESIKIIGLDNERVEITLRSKDIKNKSIILVVTVIGKVKATTYRPLLTQDGAPFICNMSNGNISLYYCASFKSAEIRIGIDAPQSYKILRAELEERTSSESINRVSSSNQEDFKEGS
jgi:sRNA-binding carbon storage regulator CsrA